jgi:hypothetical protein
MTTLFRSGWWGKFALAAGLALLIATPSVRAQDPEAGLSFGDITKKFVRNMNLLKDMSRDAELARQIGVVVAKAEDLNRISNSKNADARRSQIMRQMDKMLNREGIQQTDQKRLEKLQQELRDLDPDGLFGKARGEMNRALGELQNGLGQIHTPDQYSQDLVRLVRLHVTYYNQCLSKLPNG